MDKFLATHIVMPIDKDGGLLIVSKNAYLHEATMHMSNTLHRKSVYKLVGDASLVAAWEDKALLWQHQLAMMVIPRVLEELLGFLQTFFDIQPTPKMPVFCPLAKTHKPGFGLSSNGCFPSRPVVGMHRWATTPCSVFLATCGSMLLKTDQAWDSLRAPVLDTIDLLGRLRRLDGNPMDRNGCHRPLTSTPYTRVFCGVISLLPVIGGNHSSPKRRIVPDSLFFRRYGFGHCCFPHR